MRSHYISLIWIIFLLPAAAPSAGNITHEYISELTAALKRSNAVEFYFVHEVYQHGMSVDSVVNKASIVLRRSCGANCDQLMKDVLRVIGASVPFECQPGHEDLVIRFEGHDLLFRHSSRVMEINDRCYRSDDGIRDIVQSREFIFGR